MMFYDPRKVFSHHNFAPEDTGGPVFAGHDSSLPHVRPGDVVPERNREAVVHTPLYVRRIDAVGGCHFLRNWVTVGSELRIEDR